MVCVTALVIILILGFVSLAVIFPSLWIVYAVILTWGYLANE